MAYKNSQIDEDNLKWFSEDSSNRTLKSIKLTRGRLRGLYKFEINFNYPISVIAGKNGSGKTTILALAACAYHNEVDGFKLPKRNNSYYTFSDFFIQSEEERAIEGILIQYHIFYNKWNKKPKERVGVQVRKKEYGGRWNDYSSRMKRNVVFFGIDRVVPHSEKSVFKSYRSHFKQSEKKGWEEVVKETVSRVLNKNYDDFWYKKYRGYRLPMVKSGNNTYSGFNMGAGENALFEIFSVIYSCPPGVLLVIDEIELGLHEEAQTRFIKELKKICKKRRVQIICTTHSYNIMVSVPPDARFFVESFNDKTVITPKISPLYAAGKLSGENSNELDVFVEDTVAKSLLELALQNNIRTRINILPIGSSSVVVRQLASYYINLKKGKCVAILDGDQSSKINDLARNFVEMSETVDNKDEAKKWMKDRLRFLPGKDWPEKWILSELRKNKMTELSKDLSITEDELGKYIDEAIIAGKHNEFFYLSNKTNLDMEYIIKLISKHIIGLNKDYFQEAEKFILTYLE